VRERVVGSGKSEERIVKEARPFGSKPRHWVASRHEVAMKPHKQVTVPKIEVDLSRIKQLSQEHDDENWEFRSWLKQYAPDDIDGLVKTLSQKYFSLIDCTQCANCCRSLQVKFKKRELHALANTLASR
jgi:hypothetical protein